MANNRIAYGLCKRYGIPLPKDATPADAWEALEKHGIHRVGNANRSIHHKQSRNTNKRQDFNISSVEWRIYFKKLGELKSKYGAEYMNDGEIPPIKIDNKILLSSGTFEKPVVYEVLEIHEELLYTEDDDD